jgi:hypothetical protein
MTENLDRLKRAAAHLSQRQGWRPTRATPGSVRETIAHKIRAIDPLAPDFDSLAPTIRRIRLMVEFGDALLNDPAFATSREVQQTMLSHESIRAQLQSLLRAARVQPAEIQLAVQRVLRDQL